MRERRLHLRHDVGLQRHGLRSGNAPPAAARPFRHPPAPGRLACRPYIHQPHVRRPQPSLRRPRPLPRRSLQPLARRLLRRAAALPGPGKLRPAIQRIVPPARRARLPVLFPFC